MGRKKNQEAKRGIPRRAGKRLSHTAYYYDFVWPKNKARSLWQALRSWRRYPKRDKTQDQAMRDRLLNIARQVDPLVETHFLKLEKKAQEAA